MSRKTYISPAAWDALRMDYLNGLGTIRGLAIKHNLNPGSAETHAKRERWTADRAQYLARKRELLSSPAPSLLPVLNPPNGRLPAATDPPDGQNFAELNERFHRMAAATLEQAATVITELKLPQTPVERLALVNCLRVLLQISREILGIPTVSPIRRKEQSYRPPAEITVE